MNRLTKRFLLLVVPLWLGPAFYPLKADAQETAARLEETKGRADTSAPAIAPVARQNVFGTVPVATRSEEARKLVEAAIDQYENVLLDMSVANAHRAAQKDPDFALAYAVWSFAARRDQPNAEAMRRAENLASHGTPEEQMLVKWMTSVQHTDLLPAISSMNDLLAKYPNDKHILYLTAEWLYFQQDYTRAREMMERILKIDANFPPALNMLGYAYIETGDPDPAKAISYLKRYAALQPRQPNPEDSLGEVLRYTGDDKDSLEHYNNALKIIPNFITSQVGLGDTLTMMGNYGRARSEYDKALPMATNARDQLHAEYQKALVYFWEGQAAAGREALEGLLQKARQQKQPYAEFEIAFGRALLAENPAKQLEQLGGLEAALRSNPDGMSDSDRNLSLASVLREEVRIHAAGGHSDAAHDAIAKLEAAAASSRDLIVENCYESARGYELFAEGDFTGAVDELATDPHSPLVLEQLAAAQHKLGSDAAERSVRTRLKYMRAPTVEWYVASHTDRSSAIN